MWTAYRFDRLSRNEIRIAIARFAFRAWALPWRQWITVGDGWRTNLHGLPGPSGEQGLHVVEYKFGGGSTVNAGFSKRRAVWSPTAEISRLRRSIREMCGFTGRYGVADIAVHLARKTSYLA